MMRACALAYNDGRWSRSVATAGAFMSKWAGGGGADWQSRGLREAGQARWQGFCVLGNNDTPCHVLWSLLLHGLKWSCELNPLQLDLVSQAVSVMAEALAMCREPRYILERQACLCPRWRFINMVVTSLAPLETSATLRLAFRAMAPQQVACCSEYLPALFTCFQTQVPLGAASRTHVAWWEPGGHLPSGLSVPLP